MVEIWRPIQGYEDSYEVSNLGNVKSLKWVSVSQSYGFVWKFAE